MGAEPSFRDAETATIWDGRRSRRRPPDIQGSALRKLRLISMSANGVRPLPAISRFAVGQAEIREAGTVRKSAGQQNYDAQ